MPKCSPCLIVGRHVTSPAFSHGEARQHILGRPCNRGCVSEASSFIDAICLAWRSSGAVSKDLKVSARQTRRQVPTGDPCLPLLQVHLRMDQPNAALDAFSRAAEQLPSEIAPLLGQARICDALNEAERGVELYKKVSSPCSSLATSQHSAEVQA